MAGLKTRKQQRLVVVSIALTSLIGATLLILFALGGESLSLFLQPSDVQKRNVAVGQNFRLGGLVETGSFSRLDDGLTFRFTVTDCLANQPVEFTGILPDLFREGQGVVTEGALNESGVFMASTVLAKHDENYRPPGTMPKEEGQCSHPDDQAAAASYAEGLIVAGEIGHFALLLALMFALVGATVPHIGAARGNAAFMALADRAILAQFAMAAVAFAALTYAFVTSDFSVVNVATNSHTLKPLLYKISGTWGNHEGSLLFWVLNLTLFGALVSWRGRKLPLRFRSRVLAVQSTLILGFLLFIIFTSNPFLRLDPAPFEGNGLNPLLQDPGLAFHPPMLYLGYVGLSVAFSFAVAALIEGEVTPLWARWVRPWALLAWVFLTGGIALGSWWAYYELGWGGWWFWDPVENASFMPWLVAAALLHSAIVVEKRDALKSWTILLAIIAFSLSLLGTFVVRSGVITSVHAFANDPARGIFILAFLAIVVGGSVTLYAWRAPKLAPSGLFGVVSRESALVVNNIFLSTFAAVVLVGTLYPLFVEASGAGQISVGPPFFEYAAAVLMSPLIVALGIGPLLAWKRGNVSRSVQIVFPALIVGFVAAIVLVWRTSGDFVMTAFGLGLAAWLVSSVLLEIANRLRLRKGASIASALRKITRAQWGMSMAHMGLGFILLGITISEAFTTEELTVMAPGDTVDVAGYDFTFEGVAPIVGPNYTAVRGFFTVYEGETILTSLMPEDRVYSNPVMTTTEAAIYPLFSGDLYAVIGEAASSGRWSVRLYFKPMISGLWLGAFMMMVGGVLSLSDRRLRIGLPTGRKARVSGASA